MAVQSISNVATGAATSTAGKVVDDLAKQCAKAAKAPMGDCVKIVNRGPRKLSNLQQFARSGVAVLKEGTKKILNFVVTKPINFIKKHPVAAVITTGLATFIGVKALSSNKKTVEVHYVNK